MAFSVIPKRTVTQISWRNLRGGFLLGWQGQSDFGAADRPAIGPDAFCAADKR